MRHVKCTSALLLVFRSPVAHSNRDTYQEGSSMLRVALVFLLIALVAAVLGFGWIESLSFAAGRIVFGLFLVLALLFFLVALARSAPPPGDVA
jgi:uncharacterized membrane protein YtjA (UPF0391 family)